MFELPPKLIGDEVEQLTALRDYLVRMAQSLDTNVEKVVVQTVESAVARAGTTGYGGGGGTANVENNEVKRLKSLIIKTADNIQVSIDRINTVLEMTYLAQSDFGTYREYIKRDIDETAQATVERFDAEMETISAELDRFMENIRGEIRRGIIEDPDHPGSYIMGIAIAQELRFTGNTTEDAGLTYYELAPHQTFGFYTSTGWQYWIDGAKRGWFNSEDGMLHVENVAVEQSLMLGAGWLMTATGGFGLRYVGS